VVYSGARSRRTDVERTWIWSALPDGYGPGWLRMLRRSIHALQAGLYKCRWKNTSCKDIVEKRRTRSESDSNFRDGSLKKIEVQSAKFNTQYEESATIFTCTDVKESKPFRLYAQIAPPGRQPFNYDTQTPDALW